jgi:hypothetical protein
MTKEEYLKKHTALKEKLYQLDIDYIKSNSPIPKGTKVKITKVNCNGDTRVSYGFIDSYFLNCHEVIPSVLAMKKDGTPSIGHLYFPRKSIIEPCNE